MITIEITDTIEAVESLAIDVVEPTTTVANAPAETTKPVKVEKPKIDVQPVLQKLFELYPHLFCSQFLPLKLGT